MSVNKENFLQHELIGLKAVITKSSNPKLKGKEGIIMDETRNTITIKEKEDLKVIPKAEVGLQITLPNEEDVKVDGGKLVSRPEDRTKKFGA